VKMIVVAVYHPSLIRNSSTYTATTKRDHILIQNLGTFHRTSKNITLTDSQRYNGWDVYTFELERVS
jgi:hypothetical protein